MSNEEIKELCDKLNFTYIDSSNESKYTRNKKKQTYVRFICNIHQKYGVQEKSLFDLKRSQCKCRIHNYEYMVSPRTILYNKSSGCPLCTQSIGENKMIQILHNMGYDVIQQHTFPDCKYIGLLRFDAYCTDSNIAFEYQGQQHYYPVDFSGKGVEYAQQQYEDGLIRDNIKRKYCKENNIRLIEVPYWEYNNMELFLCNELSR